LVTRTQNETFRVVTEMTAASQPQPRAKDARCAKFFLKR
jgi:hypothetical protein